jgi:hypothetical protein
VRPRRWRGLELGLVDVLVQRGDRVSRGARHREGVVVNS